MIDYHRTDTSSPHRSQLTEHRSSALTSSGAGKCGVGRHLVLSNIACIFLVYFATVRVEAATSPPALRPETTGHTAAISAIASDQYGKLLVTGSKDKSIRVWDSESGALLKTLHPIIGDGEVGEVTAVAISPDARLIAAAIHMTADKYPSDAVLIFERRTGALVQTLGAERPNILVQPNTARVLHDNDPVGASSPTYLSLSGLTVTKLTFTADSTTLVVAFADRQSGEVVPLGAFLAIRVSDWTVVGTPPRVDTRSMKAMQLRGTPQLLDLTFDRDGRMLATGLAHPYNGQITPSVEVFDSRIRPIASVPLPPESLPAGLSLSPDRSTLAIGDSGKPVLRLLAQPGQTPLTTLDPRQALSKIGGDPYSLPLVSWSTDTPTLFGAGSLKERGSYIVRWENGGQGAQVAFRITDQWISSLHALAGGRVIFGTEDGALGQIDREGTRRWLGAPGTLGLRARSPGQGLRLDASGLKVYIPPCGDRPSAVFAPAERDVSPAPVGAETSFVAPAMIKRPVVWGSKGGELIFRNDVLTPQLVSEINSHIHTLSPDMLWDIAPAAMGDDVYLGTSSSILRINSKHHIEWTAPVPGGAYQIASASNGLWLVASLGDGTIRWYSTADGALLLSLFLHADLKRWILWSPTGYYDASIGGENLIGWYVERGMLTSPDFYPASRFRSTYHAPQVVAGMLKYQDEAEAIRRTGDESSPVPPPVSIAKQPPPIVTILAPEPGTTIATEEVTLDIMSRSDSSARVDEYRILIDGRPVDRKRVKISTSSGATSATKGEELRRVVVALPSRDVLISVMARSRFGWSEEASIPVRRSNPAITPNPKPGQEFVIEPRLFLLSIGVSDYTNDAMDLRYAAKDARDIVTVMTKQQGALYRKVESRLVVDGEATRDNILSGLEWLQRSVTQHDVAMIFMAGHGINHSGHYYFLPHDADLTEIKRTLLPDMEVQRTLEQLPGKVLMFLDTCHSGNILGPNTRGAKLADDQNGFVNELMAAENGVIVFTASSGAQASQESPEWQNGVFTRVLVEGLGGKADYLNTGRITVNMISLYTSERVNQLTSGSQTPMTARPSTVRDFPIAVGSQK